MSKNVQKASNNVQKGVKCIKNKKIAQLEKKHGWCSDRPGLFASLYVSDGAFKFMVQHPT